MLYFVRHGQSQANVDRIFAGQRYPTALTALGKQQAEREGYRILGKRLHIDQIITSPIERAYDTAKIMAHIMGIHPDDIEIDARFAEYDMGELSGQSTKGVTPIQRISAPGAEDPKAFQARITEALADAKTKPGNTLIVSHAGVGRMLKATQLGLEPSRFYEFAGYPNAEIVELKSD